MIDLGFSPEWGYAGLFLIAFLSATLLPLGSEVGVTVMTLSGYHRPTTWAVATAGNTLGALLNYGLGRWGRTIVDRRRPEAEGKATARAAAALQRWGAPILIFSWSAFAPVPLCSGSRWEKGCATAR
jgi:membrane protein YqaA with SNARE-associated domain